MQSRRGRQADAVPSFAGCTTAKVERGKRLAPDGNITEPFGFRDGIGQPLIEGVDPPSPNRDAPIAAGEFILGYRDVDGNDQIREDAVGAAFRALCFNGTYMVFRKIEQHVDVFRAEVGDSDLGIRIFGRRMDGSSLVVDPAQANPDDFNYQADSDGSKCPFGSHVRRVNPRNDESRRHRILRRGIPYADEDGTTGMHFVCFNARIDSQFEFLQSEWCEKGDFLGSFTDARDPIIGGGGVFFDPASSSPRNLKPFVTVRGGEYFFAPGMAALDGMASGKFDSAPAADAESPSVDAAALTEQIFDPLTHVRDKSLATTLLTNRSVEQQWIAWPSGKRQAVYYVACREHVRAILADDVAFSSSPYARKIAALLETYDFASWLGPNDPAPDLMAVKKVMLGMTRADPEKQERVRMLNEALGASSLAELRQHLSLAAETIARPIVDQFISADPNGLDVAKTVAYAVPLAFAVGYLGFPVLQGFSDTYKALYFSRASIDDAQAAGFLDLFPKDGAQAALPPELYELVHPVAVFFLIDLYETDDALQFARLAVKELLDRLGAEVLAEQDRIAKGKGGPTLLSGLLKCSHPGVDEATFRLRVGMIIVELVVGGIDTTAKGVVNVVDTLLSNPAALAAAQAAVAAADDARLNAIILEALRISPVAPLIVRECPEGKTLQLSNAPYTFEAGSRVFLITEAAMKDSVGAPPADLRGFVLDDAFATALDPIRRLAFGDGAHGCLGSETVLAEIRVVLKALLPLRNFRRAAGPTGKKREVLELPVALEVRFGP